jgi:hypothetical protein
MRELSKNEIPLVSGGLRFSADADPKLVKKLTKKWLAMQKKTKPKH